jgi:hypothetical protein
MTEDKPDTKPKDEQPIDQKTGEALEQWGDAPATMKKTIQLKVALLIEGEDAPAHDFNKSTIKAVEEVIAAGSAKHPELKITIKKISEK